MPPRLPDDLLRPEAWPAGGAVAAVQLLQTHVSWLFFVGERVYKVKKPVRFPFLDFSTPERRREACAAEVALNAALAPGVYLRVLPLAPDAAGRLAAAPGREAAAVDWAVEMVRLPAERMLDALLARGEADAALMDHVAAVLVPFHRDADHGPEVRAFGTPEAVARRIGDNLREAEPLLAPELAPRLRRRLEAWLASARPTLERRLADDRIRDGHGDLHAANVCCLPERVVVFDRIEFSRAFRCNDVAADVAFLAMDLAHRERADLGRAFVTAYAERSGDAGLGGLVPPWMAHYAAVRAKVDGLAARDAGVPPDERATLARRSHRYGLLALGALLPPALVLTHGLPASGKSTLARELSRALCAEWLRSDAVRLEHADTAGERYSEAGRSAVYARLLARAEDALAAGRSAVVDATFQRRAWRAPFVELARRRGVPLLLVETRADPAVLRERLERRAREGADPSEADAAVLERLRRDWEPADEVAPDARLVVDAASAPPEDQALAVLARLDDLTVPDATPDATPAP